MFFQLDSVYLFFIFLHISNVFQGNARKPKVIYFNKKEKVTEVTKNMSSRKTFDRKLKESENLRDNGKL